MNASGDAPGSQPVDLNELLNAWNSATTRLERTHRTLGAEVRRLTRELEQKNDALARKNRLADLGQMAAHVAHEVRNNLVPLKLYLSLLRRRLKDDVRCRDLIVKFDAGFTALEAIVSDLLQFTANRQPVWRPFSIRKMIEQICESLESQLEAQAIGITIEIPLDQSLQADADLIRRAVLNLVLNALDAMPHGGHLYFTSFAQPERFELEIADTGPGLPASPRRQLFEPFFTTKGEGTGLGLSIVERVAQAHGGQVLAHNCAEGGAAFTLRIPQPRFERAAA